VFEADDCAVGFAGAGEDGEDAPAARIEFEAIMTGLDGTDGIAKRRV